MTEPSPHILVVEDDREIGTMLARFLGEHGYRVSHAQDGRAMDRLLEAARIDLVILDLMLPGEDGLTLCRRLRASMSVPIIMLTAMGEPTDRIVGLEMGADDYISKPFNQRELLARLRAVLRRAGRTDSPDRAPESGALVFAGWTLTPSLRELASPEGVRVQLTSGEFDLLLAFCEHPRRVLNRDQLLDLTRGRAATLFDRSIDVLVSRLRRKIEADPKDPQIIKTVRAGGYMLTAEVTQS